MRLTQMDYSKNITISLEINELALEQNNKL